jgi:hypothetical protein
MVEAVPAANPGIKAEGYFPQPNMCLNGDAPAPLP